MKYAGNLIDKQTGVDKLKPMLFSTSKPQGMEILKAAFQMHFLQRKTMK